MQPDAAPIRVLIADDHPVVRRGMKSLLDSLDGVQVVGEAADGAAAVREAQLSRPNVVVMDLQMPALDGVEATRRLAAAVPDTAVLVLTMFEDDETVSAAPGTRPLRPTRGRRGWGSPRCGSGSSRSTVPCR